MKELAVGSRQLTPVSPMGRLEHSYAELICSTCGHYIGQVWDTWEGAERDALRFRIISQHKCGMRPLNQEEEVKQAMIQHRATHPGLSFEEECKVYNEIMQNQTYI